RKLSFRRPTTCLGVSFEHHIGRPHLTLRAKDTVARGTAVVLETKPLPRANTDQDTFLKTITWEIPFGVRTNPFTLSEYDVGSGVRHAGVCEWGPVRSCG